MKDIFIDMVNTFNEEPDWLSVKDVAERLECSERTVWNLIKSKKLNRTCKYMNRRVIHKDSVYAWMIHEGLVKRETLTSIGISVKD